ncbi:MAG: hypothetical protein RSF40_08880 [Oscillospiraceae bacterium]
MTNINAEILNAVDITIKAVADKLPFDKTVVGVITAVLGNNKYTVRIAGKSYTLTDASAYMLNDTVWVRIPCNNYNLMFIDRKKVN